MQTTSKLKIIRSETIIAHRHIASLWIHQSWLLRESQILSHLKNIRITIFNERAHLRYLPFGNSTHPRKAKTAIGKDKGRVDVGIVDFITCFDKLVNSLEGEHGG